MSIRVVFLRSGLEEDFELNSSDGKVQVTFNHYVAEDFGSSGVPISKRAYRLLKNDLTKWQEEGRIKIIFTDNDPIR